MDEVEDEKEKEKKDPGYFWALLSGIHTSMILVVAIGGASLLCLTYIIGSVLLWILGICRVCMWFGKNWTANDENIPDAMPGQETTDHWKNAWELARLRNDGISEEGGQANFHVVPLLKTKTGLDMQHLARLSKARDAKSKSERELVEVDHNLPDARIDLEHLRLMVKSRAKQRWEDSITNANTAAHPPVPSTAGGGTGDGGGGDGGGGGVNHAFGGADEIGRASAAPTPNGVPAPAPPPPATGVADTDGGSTAPSVGTGGGAAHDLGGGDPPVGGAKGDGRTESEGDLSIGGAPQLQTQMLASHDESTETPVKSSNHESLVDCVSIPRLVRPTKLHGKSSKPEETMVDADAPIESGLLKVIALESLRF